MSSTQKGSSELRSYSVTESPQYDEFFRIYYCYICIQSPLMMTIVNDDDSGGMLVVVDL